MRYMQMIKRCKLPLKKATQDVELHGEEQAKRCSLSAAELRPASPGWEERLGHLRHSAVARLLVEGKLPADTASSSPLSDCGAAMDLSKSSVLDKARDFRRDDYRLKTDSLNLLDATADRIRHQMGVEMEALRTRASSNEVRFAGWKCRYCPYTANTAKKLYSHYQFHQQLLTSHSSKPHMEWLTAYRQSKDVSDTNSSSSMTSSPVTSSTNMTSPTEEDMAPSSQSGQGPLFPLNCFPPGIDDKEGLQAMRANGLSLRYLLGGKGHVSKQSTEDSNSASGCLRSIVQAVMQKGTRSQTSVTTTSVYTSLINGSSPHADPFSSPGPLPDPRLVPGQTSITEEDRQLNSHCVNSTVIKPQPRRADAMDAHHMAGFDSSFTPRPQNEMGPCHATGTVQSEGLKVCASPMHRMVTVECQVPAQGPERPVSRESTSSYTSSASSEEINVDDIPSPNERPTVDSVSSPLPYQRPRVESISSQLPYERSRVNSITSQPPYERSRMDSITSPLNYERPRLDSVSGDYRMASRKRTHSMDSDTSSQSSHLQYSKHDSRDFSCRAHGLEMNSAAKVLCLDYGYSSSVKEEHSGSTDNAKSRHSPTTAVISSTGTPPPTHVTTDHRQESSGDCTATVSTQDTSVQCELLVPPSGLNWKNPRLVEPETAMSMPDLMTNQVGGYFQRPGASPTLIGSVKCPHCGIMFDDSVLHSIHMGCHSHSDPFICNVCGEQCSNKYGFYTHIMRGHHKP